MSKQRKTNKPFSLVEILSVIIIIAVAFTILFIYYVGHIEKTRQVNDLNTATDIVETVNMSIVNSDENIDNCIIEVIWATKDNENVLRISEAKNYVSKLSGTAYEPKGADLSELANNVFSLLNINGDTMFNEYYGSFTEGESKIANNESFVFHINPKTGEIAFAKGFSENEDYINNWVEVIGVELKDS